MTVRYPLEKYRDRFVGTESGLVYFDGNSLGRPLEVTAGRGPAPRYPATRSFLLRPCPATQGGRRV